MGESSWVGRVRRREGAGADEPEQTTILGSFETPRQRDLATAEHTAVIDVILERSCGRAALQERGGQFVATERQATADLYAHAAIELARRSPVLPWG